MKNYYEILEVHPKASAEVIEKAYAVLIDKHKTAQNPDVQAIATITEAYGVLSNTFIRDQYDQEIDKIKNEKLQENEVTKTKIKQEKEKTKRKIKNDKPKKEVEQKSQIGTMGGVINILKSMIETIKGFNFQKKDKATRKKDFLALGITILLVILILVVLWFIPITNQFVRELTVESPMLSWMFK